MDGSLAPCHFYVHRLLCPTPDDEAINTCPAQLDAEIAPTIGGADALGEDILGGDVKAAAGRNTCSC
jgi:hypothetical protein